MYLPDHTSSASRNFRRVPGRQRGARRRINGDDSIRESEIFSTSLKLNLETAYLVNGPGRSNFRGIVDDRRVENEISQRVGQNRHGRGNERKKEPTEKKKSKERRKFRLMGNSKNT